MPLSSDLISQFVKVTKDDKQVQKETTVYGTVVYDGKLYVKLDGSDLLTPISTTTNVKDGERVTVLIKDHTATVTGNISSPAARTEEVEEVSGQVSEFGTVVTHKITADDVQAMNGYFNNIIAIAGKYSELSAVTAEIETLRADIIEGNSLNVNNIEAITAKIESIEAKFGDFTDISADELNAVNATITNLKAYAADFTYLSAVKADIKELDASKLSADDAQIKYANIDFANIGEAAIRKIFADTGLIRDFVVGDQTVTGELVGVIITGDLIKANTLKAEQLVVRGTDGNYYKLNTDFSGIAGVEPVEEDSIHGSTIVTKSITAEKVRVSDLVAFDATIGGFNITDHSLYSGVKESINNATRGVYLDREGQIAIGDGNRFLKFYISKDGISEVFNDTLVITERETGIFAVDIVDNVLLVDRASESYTPAINIDIENETLRISNTYTKLDIAVDSLMLSRRSKDINDVLDDVDSGIADYRSFLAKFSKYIRFMEDENGNPSDTAMTIGSGDSVITLEIDNVKGLVFKKNGNEFGSWDGTNFHTGNIKIDVEERAQFGNFAFVPRSDGSLSFLKVGELTNGS